MSIENSPRKKLVILVGPTASGKTGLGIGLAKKFKGEVISADSRQIYKKMDIGTAKPEQDTRSRKSEINCGCNYVVEGVLHHLIDIVNPDEKFTVADFKIRAEKCSRDIMQRKKIPFLVGGTGLYIRALVDNLDFAKVQSNEELRKDLENKSLEELIELLEKHDPKRLAIIDVKNPRRMVRAAEIALSGKETSQRGVSTGRELNCEFLQLGIKIPQAELYRRIDERIEEQIKDGLVEEVKKLSKKYSWDLSSMSGIGYRQIGYYLCGEMSLEEVIERLKIDTHHYAKRQITWFKRDQNIQWLDGADRETAEALVERFLEE